MGPDCKISHLLSQRLASLGIIGAQLRFPGSLQTPHYDTTVMYEGFMVALNWATMMPRETPVSRTTDCGGGGGGMGAMHSLEPGGLRAKSLVSINTYCQHSLYIHVCIYCQHSLQQAQLYTEKCFPKLVLPHQSRIIITFFDRFKTNRNYDWC